LNAETAGTPTTPRPNVSVQDAVAVAAALFNLGGAFKELGSQQDRNFRIDAPTGRYLLKFANPMFSYDELEVQNYAMAALAAHGVAAPVAIGSVNGFVLEQLSEAGLYLRLTSFVEGEPLTDAGYLAPEVIGELGSLCARTVLAFAALDHPGLDRTLQWDLKRADAVVDSLASYVSDEGRRRRVTDATAGAWARITEVRDQLRERPIHGDLTDDNVVCTVRLDGRLHPFGVIDLGDVLRSWLVAEIAITCSSVLHHNPTDPLSIIPAIREFHCRVPLTRPEVQAIWPLIVARGAVLAVSGEHQVAVDPTNEYAVNNLPHEWTVFDVATSVPSRVATEAILQSLGLSEPVLPPKETKPLLADLSGNYATADFSTASEALNDGAWIRPNIEDEVFASLASRDGYVVAQYGEFRLTRTTENSTQEPENFALHLEIALPRSAQLRAPLACRVLASTKSSIVLRARDYDLYLNGIKPTVGVGDKLKAGGVFAVPVRSRRVRVTAQICTDHALTPPAFTNASLANAWRSICPDPSLLLGIDSSQQDSSQEHSASKDMLARRGRVLPSVSHHYYKQPPHITRGWQSHLVDNTGRSYLDMVNNVSAVGHAHPGVADAASKQLRLLNTNSRFHYDAIVEYAERLAELAPDPLDTVLLVNSGTEAVDLALQIANAYTGHRLVVAHAEAYHGWSLGADGVSASLADNPNALATRPAWARFVSAPNSLRGIYPGMASARSYVADAAALMAGWSADGGIAAYISEPIFGNGGGIVMPDGYLAGMYELTRSYGGLCIADEIQVGMGRLGHYFWGFEQQGVVPDVVTVAKSIGNGQPLGAVITRRDIADALARQGNLFSSAGGNPVSCRIGLAVLDALNHEGLVGNAAEIGDYLHQRLIELAGRHEIIGAVHGMGLYQGVELVRSRETLEPATEEAAQVCNRLLELGIIDQPTGDRFNILKLKPPMCLTTADVDFYIDSLDHVLTYGW